MLSYIKRKYLHQRRYNIQYSCLLKNKVNQRNRLFVVLPIPNNNINQKLLQEPVFSIKPNSIDFDNKYKNKYGVWDIILKPYESAKIKQDLVIEVTAVCHKIEEQLSIKSYDRDEEYETYTEDNSFINLSCGKVSDLVYKIVGSEQDVGKIIERINNYIVCNLKYGEPIEELYTALEAIENRFVDCGGFSVLFVAACIANRIPARIVSGFWAGYNRNTMHAWAEALLPNKKWIPVDPAVEQLSMSGRTKKFGKIGSIGSDRVVLSVGCDIPIFIDKKEYRLPILQNPFIVAGQGDGSVDAKVIFTTQKFSCSLKR